MADPITDERLAEIRQSHADCEPDDGPRCEALELLAEVDRLRFNRAANEEALRHALRHADRIRDLEAEHVEDQRVIEQVRELHQPLDCINPAYCDTEQSCRGCNSDTECNCSDHPWPCPTVALLPPPTDGSTDDD